jgi:hypothetical protein
MKDILIKGEALRITKITGCEVDIMGKTLLLSIQERSKAVLDFKLS